MDTIKRISVLLAVLALVPLAWGQIATNEQPATNESPFSLTIDLVDGSRIVGVPGIASISVQTAYAKLDIALKQVRSITMEKDRELAVFEMRNGDRVKGAMILKTLDLQTAVGKVSVGIELIRALQVMGAKPGHLLLWNKLGSDREVANSEMGTNGIIEGSVGYAPVKHGNGVVLKTGNSLIKFDKPFGANFPEAGCIEFWWIPAHDEDSSTGSHMAERTVFVLSSAQMRPGGWPAMEMQVLYRVWGGDCANRTAVYFLMRDEVSGSPIAGIICAYELNFTAGQLMHLALSWNKEWGPQGIKLFKDGVEVPFAFSNGGDIGPVIDTIRRRLPDLTFDLALLRWPRCPAGSATQFDAEMYMENLKIWDYAKTNFADRLIEAAWPR